MGRPPLLSKLQRERERENNPEIRTGRAGEGHAGVIWLEQNAEKSNLLWSDNLKATKETNRGGSSGSLAACAQYFIINDNNTKEKGGRKGEWGVRPPPSNPSPLPKHTQGTAQRLTRAQAPGRHKSTSRRKESAGRMKNGLALVLLSSRLNAWASGDPLQDSAWFIRTSVAGEEAAPLTPPCPHHWCSAVQPGPDTFTQGPVAKLLLGFPGLQPLGSRQSLLLESAYCLHLDRDAEMILGINTNGNGIYCRDRDQSLKIKFNSEQPQTAY